MFSMPTLPLFSFFPPIRRTVLKIDNNCIQNRIWKRKQDEVVKFVLCKRETLLCLVYTHSFMLSSHTSDRCGDVITIEGHQFHGD